MRRDLWWMAPVWVVMAVAIAVWRAAEGDSAGRVVAAFVAVIGLGVVLTPVLWLRYRGFPRGRREIAVGVRLLGLAIVWFTIALGVVYAVVSLLEGT
jgi:hypothetical protein